MESENLNAEMDEILDDDIQEIGKKKKDKHKNHHLHNEIHFSKKSFVVLMVGDLQGGAIPSVASLNNNTNFDWNLDGKRKRTKKLFVFLTCLKKIFSFFFFFFFEHKVIETNYSCIIEKSEFIDLRVIGLPPIDQKLKDHQEHRQLFLESLKMAHIVIFVFSLVSPLSLQRAVRVRKKKI